jgi:hypothetical protein
MPLPLIADSLVEQPQDGVQQRAGLIRQIG